jgi:hypothetical protein
MISRDVGLFVRDVLEWSMGIVQRGEDDSMARGDGLDFFDTIGGDEASSLGEGFEAAL